MELYSILTIFCLIFPSYSLPKIPSLPNNVSKISNYFSESAFDNVVVHKRTGQVYYIAGFRGFYELAPNLTLLASIRFHNVPVEHMFPYFVDIDYKTNYFITCKYLPPSLISHAMCIAFYYRTSDSTLHFIKRQRFLGIENLEKSSLLFCFVGQHRNQNSQSTVSKLLCGFETLYEDQFHSVIVVLSLHPSTLFEIDKIIEPASSELYSMYGYKCMEKYSYGFNSGEHNFFLSTVQCLERNTTYSNLIQICVDNAFSKQEYIRIPLQCRYNEWKIYHYVQAANVGKPGLQLARSLNIGLNDNVLFAVFSTSDEFDGHSALCVYPLHVSCDECLQYSNDCYSNINFCGHTPSNTRIPHCRGSVPIITFNSPMYYEYIITKPSEDHTEVVMGTNDGYLAKVIVNNSSSACKDAFLDVGKDGSKLLSLTRKNNSLYILTTETLDKIDLRNCSYYDNYNSCVRDTLTFCGWCGITNKCTSKCHCTHKPYKAWYAGDFRTRINITQCNPNQIQIGGVEMLKLSIKNMPYIRDDFICTFTFANKNVSTNATLVPGNSHHDLYCLIPKTDDIPGMPRNIEYMNATLSFHTNYVECIAEMNIQFFNCNVWKSCKACVTSMFPCKWHLENKKCVYDERKIINVYSFDACPYSVLPTISSFWPSVRLWEGSTNITIKGENLGYRFEDIEHGINVAGIACIPYRDMYVQMKKITCAMRSCPSPDHEGLIEIYVRGRLIRSSQNFKCVDIIIHSISPKKGPSYGDTPLTIKGENLNCGRSVKVLIDGAPCRVFLRNSSTIQCITGLFHKDSHMNGNVRLKFDKIFRDLTTYVFQYDETFAHHRAMSIIPAGGVEVMFDLAHFSPTGQLLFHVHGEKQDYTSLCISKQNLDSLGQSWICLSPLIAEIDSGSKGANYPKKMKYSLTDGTGRRIRFEGDRDSYVSLYPNPEFHYYFSSYIEDSKEQFLIIYGENIDKACKKTDLNVNVDNGVCKVLSISINLVVCQLSISSSMYSKNNSDRDYSIIVEPNNVSVTIGANFTAEVRKQQIPLTTEVSPPENFIMKYLYYEIAIIIAVIVVIIAYLSITRKKYSHAVRNLQQQVNVMGMEAITAKQCIKRVLIKNKVILDEYSSKILKLPAVVIENTSIPWNSEQTSGESEYILPPDVEWEFVRSNLTLGRCLGEGEFGMVLQGEAENIVEKNIITTVAVKMLKDDHSDDDMIDLVCEMEIMKFLGTHDNVLRLLGCCTVDGPLFVITEYAQHGNLREFLRKHLPSNDEIAVISLSQENLLMFAVQVAKGMRYLASIKCVHRDLAARNILLADNYIAKVADFGLSRDISNKEYYKKRTDGRLPVKWMAPESLHHSVYSTQSDVWSYGILLWEIFTLGAVPYSSLQKVENLYQILCSGYRMEIPPNCPVNIYSLMCECWSFLPKDRPSFSAIVDILSSIEIPT